MSINFTYKVLISLLAFFIIVVSLLAIPSHTETINYYKSILPEFHHPEDIGAKFLKPRDYLVLKMGLCVYILSALALLLFMIFKRKYAQRLLMNIFTDLQSYFSNTLHVFKVLSKKQMRLLATTFTLLIAFKIYYCLNTYPYIDEVFSFVGFVNEGPLVTATFYPVPNNHVFNNLICIFFKNLGLSPYWTMRLPTLLCWLSTLVLLFVYLKPKLGFSVSYVSIVLFALLPNLAFFSFFGRGYQLQVLLFLLSIIFSHKIWIYKQKRALIYYLICAVSACYTAPSYAYCIILLSVYHFILAAHYKCFWSYVFLAPCLVGLGCIYVYFPIFGISGLESFFQNEYVSGSDGGLLILQNVYLLKEVFVAIGLFPIVYVLRKKLPPLQSSTYITLLIHTFYISLACVATFLVIQIVSGRIAPERTLLWISYLKVWIAVFVTYTVYLFLNKPLRYLLLGIFSIVACFAGYKRHLEAFSNSYYDGYHEMSMCTVHAVQHLEQQKPKSIVTNDIEFYCQWKFKYPDSKNIVYHEDCPESMPMQYLVLNEETQPPQNLHWQPIQTTTLQCSKRSLYLRKP